MYSVVCFLLFVAFRGALTQNECVPEPVDSLTLYLNYTLSWTASSNCDVTHYIIYIHNDEDNLDYIFQTDDTQLDVSFLPACERYRFTIMAYDLHMSSSAYIEANIPAPPGANITISDFQVVESEGSVSLHWEVDYQYAHCAQFYRVIIWDGESAPTDIYTSYNDILLTDLVPCTQYELGVAAIYNLLVEGPISIRDYQAPPQNLQAPILLDVRPGSTFIDMTLQLAPYQTNRCAISSVILDGSPFVNQVIPITDSPARPSIPIHLESLQPDRMYLLRITATNTAGPSQPLTVGVQTQPAVEGPK